MAKAMILNYLSGAVQNKPIESTAWRKQVNFPK